MTSVQIVFSSSFPTKILAKEVRSTVACAGPRNEKEKVWLNSSLSIGYGREIGVIMLIYIMALAYAASSPIILPFALCYFLTAWVSPSPRDCPFTPTQHPLLKIGGSKHEVDIPPFQGHLLYSIVYVKTGSKYLSERQCKAPKVDNILWTWRR